MFKLNPEGINEINEYDDEKKKINNDNSKNRLTVKRTFGC